MQTNHRAGRERNRQRLALALATGVTFAGLAAAAPALADYYDGITAYQNHDYAVAVRELQPLADQGDPRAQRLIGLMYRDGQGLTQDPVRAYMWLDLAASNGQADAAFLRDGVARGMTPAQVAQAKQQVEAWRLGQSAAAPPPSNDAESATSPMPPSPPATPQPLTRSQIADLQWQLAVHGYDPGAADGVAGSRTQAAIRQYQADAGLPVDGQPSPALLDHLQYAQPAVRNKAAVQNGGASTIAPSTIGQAQAPPPAAATAEAKAAPTAVGVAPALLHVYTTAVQQELTRRGYRPGPIDGVLGPQTRAAIRKYQRQHGLPVTGEVSLELLNHLRLINGSMAPTT